MKSAGPFFKKENHLVIKINFIYFIFLPPGGSLVRGSRVPSVAEAESRSDESTVNRDTTTVR